MRFLCRLLYLFCFFGLAVSGTLAVDRAMRPSIAPLLVGAVLLATLAGLPGLVHRRAWPVSLLFLPLAGYLLVRVQWSALADGPGGEVGSFLGALRTGGRAYMRQHFPLDTVRVPELKLLVSLVVYGAVWLASFAALSLRRALPAIGIIVVLVGFGLTVDSAARSLWLPFVFLLLAGGLLALSRSLGRERGRPLEALAGGAVGLLAGLLALSLLGATGAASGAPWRDWRTWGAGGSDTVHVGFDWLSNFPGLLKAGNHVEVMRVKSPVASYWRANSLDFFNGEGWYSARTDRVHLDAQRGDDGYSYNIHSHAEHPPGRGVTQRFELGSLTTDYLFTGGVPRALILPQAESLSFDGQQSLRAERYLGPDLRYTLRVIVPRLKPADLVGRGRDYPPEVLRHTGLPFPTAPSLALSSFIGPDPEQTWRELVSGSSAREWVGLYRLNREIVGSATDPYQVALRVETYLRRRYSYSLTPPSAGYASPYAAFLFTTHSGYCQHFAGAMAVLLRFNGIPARVAVGFTAGQSVGNDTYAVFRDDAHAWVEVYFPDIGWASFDPTPGRGLPGQGASSTSAGFVDPFAVESGGDEAASWSGLNALRGRRPDADGPRITGTGPGVSVGGRGLRRRYLWLSVIPAALVLWPTARVFVRRRGLHRGDPEARLRAGLCLLYADLRDHGVAELRSLTLEETAALLKRELDVDADRLVARVQAVLYGGRPAGRNDLMELAVLRREVRRGLRARHGWARTLRAGYGLPAGGR